LSTSSTVTNRIQTSFPELAIFGGGAGDPSVANLGQHPLHFSLLIRIQGQER
jgi:hypothetical protein